MTEELFLSHSSVDIFFRDLLLNTLMIPQWHKLQRGRGSRGRRWIQPRSSVCDPESRCPAHLSLWQKECTLFWRWWEILSREDNGSRSRREGAGRFALLLQTDESSWEVEENASVLHIGASLTIFPTWRKIKPCTASAAQKHFNKWLDKKNIKLSLSYIPAGSCAGKRAFSKKRVSVCALWR